MTENHNSGKNVPEESTVGTEGTTVKLDEKTARHYY